MRVFSAVIGLACLLLGGSGLLLLGIGPRHNVQVALTRLVVGQGVPAPVETSPVVDVEGPPVSPGGAPVERVTIPRIRLGADVVPSRLVQVGNALTWEVPAHRAGHAEGTAGAGARGNTVLLGHVSSIDAGDVFRDLGRVEVGDVVIVQGGGAEHRYRVTEIQRVTREDVAVLATTGAPALTLITCTGTWLPDVRDYSHRLAVRAILEGA